MRYVLYTSCLLTVALFGVPTSYAQEPVFKTLTEPDFQMLTQDDTNALFKRLDSLPQLPAVIKQTHKERPITPSLSDDLSNLLAELPKAETPQEQDVQKQDVSDQYPHNDPDPTFGGLLPEPEQPIEQQADTEQHIKEEAKESEIKIPSESDQEETPPAFPENDIVIDDTVQSGSDQSSDTALSFKNTLFNNPVYSLYPETDQNTKSFSLLPQNETCVITQDDLSTAHVECTKNAIGFTIQHNTQGGLDLISDLKGLDPKKYLVRYQLSAIGKNPNNPNMCLIQRVVSTDTLTAQDILQVPTADCGETTQQHMPDLTFMSTAITNSRFLNNQFYNDIILDQTTWRLQSNNIIRFNRESGQTSSCRLIQNNETRVAFECLDIDLNTTFPTRYFYAFDTTDTPNQVRFVTSQTPALSDTPKTGHFYVDITKLVLSDAEKRSQLKNDESSDDDVSKLFKNDLFSMPLKRSDKAPDNAGGLFALKPGQKLPPLIVYNEQGQNSSYDRYCKLHRDDFHALVFECELNERSDSQHGVTSDKNVFITLAIDDCTDKTCFIVQTLDQTLPSVYTAGQYKSTHPTAERFEILNLDIQKIIFDHQNDRADKTDLF